LLPVASVVVNALLPDVRVVVIVAALGEMIKTVPIVDPDAVTTVVVVGCAPAVVKLVWVV